MCFSLAYIVLYFPLLLCGLPDHLLCDLSFVRARACSWIHIAPLAPTGSSIAAAVSLIKDAYKPGKIILISVVATRQGLSVLNAEHPDVIVHAAAVDDGLSDDGLIIPGLGDVGDRINGTAAHLDPDADGSPEREPAAKRVRRE